MVCLSVVGSRRGEGGVRKQVDRVGQNRRPGRIRSKGKKGVSVRRISTENVRVVLLLSCLTIFHSQFQTKFNDTVRATQSSEAGKETPGILSTRFPCS